MADTVEDNLSNEESIDKFMSAYQSNMSKRIASTMPLDIQLPSLLYKTFSQSVIMPDSHPFVPESLPESKPGLVEQFKDSFKKYNFEHEVYEKLSLRHQSSVNNTIDQSNPSDDPIGDKWSPLDNLEDYKDIPQTYWDILMRAKSPKDYEARKKLAQEKMAHDEYFKNGSWTAAFFGGLAGSVFSLPSLLPMAAAARYARVSQNIIMNTTRQLPYVVGGTAVTSAITDTLDEGKNLSDYGYDVMRQSIAGTFLVAGAAGLSSAYNGGKLYNASKVMRDTVDGIQIKQVINEKGEEVGYKATPVPGEAKSAQRISEAQEFADSLFKQRALFAIPGITGLSKKLSPKLRGLTSNYGTTRALSNRLFDHGFELQGADAAKAIPDMQPFESRLDAIHGESMQMLLQIKGLQKQANGANIATTQDQAFSNLESNLSKGIHFDNDSFGEAVMQTTYSGKPSDIQEVNQAAKLAQEFVDKQFKRWQRSMGYREEVLPVRTAQGYLTRRYDRSNMLLNKEAWVDMYNAELPKQDAKIQELMRPVNELNEQINLIKEEIHEGINADENRQSLRNLEENLKFEQQKLIETARDDDSLSHLLEERNFLNSKDATGLKTVLEPMRAQEKEIKKTQNLLSAAKQESSKIKSILEKGISQKKGMSSEEYRTAKTTHYETNKAKLDEIAKSIDELELKLAEQKDALDRIHGDLRGRAKLGEFPETYYYIDDQGIVHFRDPNALPKFRRLYESDDHITEQALADYEKIMGQDDATITQEIINNIQSSMVSNATKERSVMIPDEVLLQNKFLDTDLSANLSNYAMSLGRQSAFNEATAGFAGSSGFGSKAIIESLIKEEKNKRRELDNITDPEKRSKALFKHKTAFDKEKEYIATLLDIAAGKRLGSKRAREIKRDITSLLVSTRLGSVPLTQATDMMGNVFKHGIVRFFRDGLTPAITTINGKIGTSFAKEYSAYASEVNLALEHLGDGLASKMMSSYEAGELTPNNKVSALLQKGAHFSGNLYLTNYIENANQRLTAFLSQSELMGLIVKYSEGNLKADGLRRLHRAGIDPEVWATRFIDSYKKAGGKKRLAGGYSSMFHEWEDLGARIKMGEAVRRQNRDVIIKRGDFDAPFFMRNPILQLWMSFTGWGFAAFNRYGVNLMQHPDVTNLLGTALIIGVGGFEGMTRKWSRGEEYKWDEEHFFADAVSSAAPFALIYKAAQWANAFTGGEMMKNFQNDKYRNVSTLGAFGGPAIGMLEDMVHVTSMMVTSKYNQTDIKKAWRMLPLMQASYMQYLSNQFLDAAFGNLPKNFSQAEGWYQ